MTSECTRAEAAAAPRQQALGVVPEACVTQVKILAIDETGKIRLSIKALAADEERSQFESFMKGGPAPAPADDTAAPAVQKRGGGVKKAPEPRGFGTLADLLAKKTKR